MCVGVSPKVQPSSLLHHQHLHYSLQLRRACMPELWHLWHPRTVWHLSDNGLPDDIDMPALTQCVYLRIVYLLDVLTDLSC